MQRDMDLIRQIAFAVERSAETFNTEHLVIDGYSQEQITDNCQIMVESELIDAIESRCRSGTTFHVRGLTAKGHDFVEAARSDTVWRRAMVKAEKTAVEITVDVIVACLKSFTPD